MLPYVVQPGDTLLRIARRFEVNAASLTAANPRISSELQLMPGLLLSIPLQTVAVYCVQPGDTVIRVAGAFSVSIQALVAANPGVDPRQLVPGQLLTVPAGGYHRIVDARAEYGHRELTADMDALQREYPFLTKTVIGHSVMGKPIYSLRLGEGARKVHFNAAMHANEWITAPLLMTFAEDAAQACSLGEKLCGTDMRTLLKEVSVWFVPLVNPDGVELAQEGLRRDHPHYQALLQMNRQSSRFVKWKANVRGVDLNDQFPAFWEEEVERRAATGPGPRDYPGEAPLTEPEALALAELTQREQFDLVVALHTQGQEIYWNYRGYEPPESERIAYKLAKVSGYKPIKLRGSDAGYKDWFIHDYRKPGFTVEVGNGCNPLPVESFPDLYDEVCPLLIAAMESAANRK
ncbi:LysM peptidoglycan-binding domain-containing protein [Paenibacillus oenotherae]|uniref:LysM peptidoglycan-binding domain-containing protein n=1 Tax=Paenibacillus oenotherae TaxID=1435645 RepID=A0ABS7D9H2_9BACL|nr:M14 family metallopeptidase [Paenibacillus oenotherae]MBW7476157.1 LysM peptidoglycan-binding domain-containing protein [Paenibacillus oenotherae]